MVLNKLKLVLASKSPRRKELLSHLNITFEIDSCDIDEISSHTNPKLFCEDIAEQKGKAVFKKQLEQAKKNNRMERLFVISSDTIVFLDGVIYGKPHDKEDAKKILKQLSDKTHTVFTAVSFIFNDPVSNELRTHLFSEETNVTFAQITDDLMEEYLATGDSLDKAGAYGIQGPSLTFISSLQGSYSNVVGFPLNRVVEELKLVLNTQDNECLKHYFN